MWVDRIAVGLGFACAVPYEAYWFVVYALAGVFFRFVFRFVEWFVTVTVGRFGTVV